MRGRAIPKPYGAEGQAGTRRCMLQQIPRDARGAIVQQRPVLHGLVGELDAAFENWTGHRSSDTALISPRGGAAVGERRDDPRFADRLKRLALPSVLRRRRVGRQLVSRPRDSYITWAT